MTKIQVAFFLFCVKIYSNGFKVIIINKTKEKLRGKNFDY